MTTSLTMSLHPLAEISSKGEDGGGRRTAAILSRWSGGETVQTWSTQNMLIVFHLPESFCQRVFNNTKQIYCTKILPYSNGFIYYYASTNL